MITTENASHGLLDSLRLRLARARRQAYTPNVLVRHHTITFGPASNPVEYCATQELPHVMRVYSDEIVGSRVVAFADDGLHAEILPGHGLDERTAARCRVTVKRAVRRAGKAAR